MIGYYCWIKKIVHQVGCKISILYHDARSKIHQITDNIVTLTAFLVSFSWQKYRKRTSWHDILQFFQRFHTVEQRCCWKRVCALLFNTFSSVYETKFINVSRRDCHWSYPEPVPSILHKIQLNIILSSLLYWVLPNSIFCAAIASDFRTHPLCPSCALLVPSVTSSICLALLYFIRNKNYEGFLCVHFFHLPVFPLSCFHIPLNTQQCIYSGTILTLVSRGD
jgi:hypothetical protein